MVCLQESVVNIEKALIRAIQKDLVGQMITLFIALPNASQIFTRKAKFIYIQVCT